MKKYRTIDLLNAVYNGKIFKNSFKNIETGEIIKQGENADGDGRIDQSKTFFNEKGFNFAPTNIYIPTQLEEWLNQEWEEIQEPVSFMEAIESCKPIRVEHEYFCMHGNYAYANHLLMKIGNILTPDQIKEVIEDGKWYIKENGQCSTPTDKTKFIKINYKDLRDNERHTKGFVTREEYEEWHEANWNDVVING